jgi:hypothetical protein
MKFEEMSDEIKASMTDEQMRRQIDVELMEGNITKVEYPGTFDLEMPSLEETNYYTVGEIYFKTQKQAEQFMKLSPMKSNYEWRIGSEIRFVEEIDDSIRIESLYDKTEIQDKGPELIEWNKKHEEHNTKKRRYENYVSARNAIYDKIWSAHEKAKEIINERNKIEQTYEEYKTLTNGDEELAYTFLVKHFGEEKVKDADVVAAATTSTDEE